MSLRAFADDVFPDAPSFSRAASRPPRSRPLVFLAEDDHDFRRMVAEALRDAGYEVRTAPTGHAMLELLTAASRGEVEVPDAIVMDVRMPRCSGIDVLGALRLADWKQPVVMITGFGDPSLHERAVSFGASVILDKPFCTDELIDVLDVLLALARGPGGKPLEGGEACDDEPEPETMRSPTSARVATPPTRRRRDVELS